MHPILFKIFGFEVHSFGFMVALGFLAGYFWMRYSAEKTGDNADRIADLSLWVLLSGIVGARLLFVIVHADQYRHNPIEIIMIWKGGLVLYGGLIGAVAAGAWLVRRKGMNFFRTADIAMPCVMLGLSIGRWGCLMVGDCYGRLATGLPWAIRFPDVPGTLMAPKLIDQPLHPTQIYMSLNALVIFVILTLVLRRRRFEGQVFLLCLILYSITRSVIEVYRGDNEERGYLGPLSTSQWISLAVVLFALWQYVLRYRRETRKARSGPGA
jgi:phosphatidylglycerol:prolipoprotein diacylglycerol transferase